VLCLALAPARVEDSARAGRGASVERGQRITLEEALALALPGCEIERQVVYLTDEQKKQAAELAGVPVESGIVRPYRGTKDGKLAGTVYFDAHKVRTLRETLLVLVDPAGKVARVELVAFGEPDEYAPRARWFAQFAGRALDDELQLDRGIRGITGATLSARAATAAVRRVLALHAVLDPRPK
jgi:hypothetical protein